MSCADFNCPGLAVNVLHRLALIRGTANKCFALALTVLYQFLMSCTGPRCPVPARNACNGFKYPVPALNFRRRLSVSCTGSKYHVPGDSVRARYLEGKTDNEATSDPTFRATSAHRDLFSQHPTSDPTLNRAAEHRIRCRLGIYRHRIRHLDAQLNIRSEVG